MTSLPPQLRQVLDEERLGDLYRDAPGLTVIDGMGSSPLVRAARAWAAGRCQGRLKSVQLLPVENCPPLPAGAPSSQIMQGVLAAGPKGPESVDVAAFAALVEGGRGRLSAPARATFWRNESFRSRGGFRARRARAWLGVPRRPCRAGGSCRP